LLTGVKTNTVSFLPEIGEKYNDLHNMDKKILIPKNTIPTKKKLQALYAVKLSYLVLSTHLKNISQMLSFPFISPK